MAFTTFNDLLNRAAWRLPDQTFLYWSDRDRSLTYAQAVQVADQVAGALAELGVAKGDRVAIFAHNGLDYVMAMLGIWRLGAISTHISVLQADTLAYYVNDSEPKVLIYTGDMFPVIERNRADLPSVQHYICYDGAQDGAHDWSTLLKAAPPPPPVAVTDLDAAHLSYTSGTSGQPKGALLAHGYTARATHCIAERLQLTHHDVSLGATSLSSSYHLVANLLPGLHRGITIGVMSKWNAETAWGEMERRGVTFFPGNPPFLTDLLHLSRQRGRKPGNLRVCLSGGAPAPPALKQAYFDELGVFVIEGYGQSELGGFVAMGYPRPGENLAAVGPTLPDREVRVVNEAGQEVAIGEPGEMVIRDSYMLGYWKKAEKTAETLRDGWLHTGDVGRMDEAGYLYFLGRWSERIVSGGKVILPRPMEEALYRHPAVQHVAVVGRPDQQLGEIPKAIVSLFPGQSATPEELHAHCRQLLGPDNSPAVIEIIPDMPMTPTGKVAKADLQRREREGQL